MLDRLNDNTAPSNGSFTVTQLLLSNSDGRWLHAGSSFFFSSEILLPLSSNLPRYSKRRSVSKFSCPSVHRSSSLIKDNRGGGRTADKSRVQSRTRTQPFKVGNSPETSGRTVPRNSPVRCQITMLNLINKETRQIPGWTVVQGRGVDKVRSTHPPPLGWETLLVISRCLASLSHPLWHSLLQLLLSLHLSLSLFEACDTLANIRTPVSHYDRHSMH